MHLPGRIKHKHKEKPRKPLYVIYIMLIYFMLSCQSHATQAKGWLPKELQNLLWFVGEENLDFAQNLLWGHLRGLWKYTRLPMGCLEEGLKVRKGKDLG